MEKVTVRNWAVEGLDSFAEELLKRSCIFLTHIISIFITPNPPFFKREIFLEHIPLSLFAWIAHLPFKSQLTLHFP